MEQISYSVRRSERARRVRVTVDATRGVDVVLPRRAPEREAAAAIRELRPWIERRVRELDRARQTVAARANTLPYLGQTLHVVPVPGRMRVHRRGDRLLVPSEPSEREAGLERWYRRAARAEIAPRLDRACARRSRGRGLGGECLRATAAEAAASPGTCLRVADNERQRGCNGTHRKQ